jgi:aspartyl-tRNA(Asn)/glutamyl-tRNA(Gln) amidotransferase subunit A
VAAASLGMSIARKPKVSGGDVRDDYRSAFGQLLPPRIGVVTNYRASDPVRVAFANAVETLRSFAHKTIELEAPLGAPFSIEHIDRDRRTISRRLFANVDVLVLSTVTHGPPTIEHAGANAQAVSAESTYFCNHYALPAISVPCGFDERGVPLGLQIVGPTWGEAAVLDVAQRFQRATTWHDHHPPL